MTQMKRIACYVRVSTDAQDLISQTETLRAYVKDAGAVYVLDGEHQMFVDHGFSGGNLNRPAFKRMMEAAERGEIDEVAVFKADRLSRSVIDFLITMKSLTTLNVAFTSVTQSLLTTGTPEGRFMMSIFLSFGEFEREMIKDRTRRASKIRKPRGLTFGPAPFGLVNGADGKVHPDPATWDAVLAIARGVRGVSGVHKSTAYKVRKRIRKAGGESYYGVPLVAIDHDNANGSVLSGGSRAFEADE